MAAASASAAAAASSPSSAAAAGSGPAHVFLGVDGGGTKTIVSVLAPDRQVLGRGVGGCTNQNSVGKEAAFANLKQAVEQALEHAGLAGKHGLVRAITLGMSGVDRPSDKVMVQGWISTLLPSARAFVFNDAVAALASGTQGRLQGVVAISGTGMICYGRSGEVEARTGGWGCLTDAGSGYAIGIDVLKAVWACYDGTGPATSLHEAVLKKLELQKTEDIIGWTYSDLAFFRVASLAILAFEEEAKGDKLARAIIESAADSIVRCLLGVARKLGFADSREPVPVVLSGSVASSPRMVELLRARLATAWPSAKLTPTLCEASVGAALLGMTLA